MFDNSFIMEAASIAVGLSSADGFISSTISDLFKNDDNDNSEVTEKQKESEKEQKKRLEEERKKRKQQLKAERNEREVKRETMRQKYGIGKKEKEKDGQTATTEGNQESNKSLDKKKAEKCNIS